MGKIIIGQRKGKIGIYKRSYKNIKAKSSYKTLDTLEKKERIKAKIISFINCNKRILLKAKLNQSRIKNSFYESFIAAEGLNTNMTISIGQEAKSKIGNILPLYKISSGTQVFNIEELGDGGSIAKSTGTFAGIMSHREDKKLTSIKLPSKSIKSIASNCRATIGIAAGGGRLEKPLLKAGSASFKFKNMRKKFPKVRKVAVNPVDHPHGGGNHQHIGHPSTVSRRSPPGQKVGLIAARRSGHGSKRKITKQNFKKIK